MDTDLKALLRFDALASTADKIAQLQQVKQWLAAFKEAEASLVDHLKEELAEGEIIYLPDGTGYKHTQRTTYEFGPGAIKQIEAMGYLAAVAGIQKGKVDKLPSAARDQVMQYATPKQTSVIISVVNKEGNIFL